MKKHKYFLIKNINFLMRTSLTDPSKRKNGFAYVAWLCLLGIVLYFKFEVQESEEAGQSLCLVHVIWTTLSCFSTSKK